MTALRPRDHRSRPSNPEPTAEYPEDLRGRQRRSWVGSRGIDYAPLVDRLSGGVPEGHYPEGIK